MTIIHTFEDIVDAMRQDPVLREAMRQQVRDEEISNRILTELTELKAGQERLEARQGRLEARQDRTEARQDRTEARQDRMEARQDRMEARQDRMESDLADLKAIQQRMQGQLNNLTGTAYERKVAKRAPRAARRYLDIRNAALVYSLASPDNPHLSNLLEQATDARAISDDQADDLEQADLILLGQTPAGEPAYAVAEVSVTVDRNDVDRAARRARILQAASGVATQAAVIGTAISDANRRRAADAGVTFIAMTE